MQRHGRPKIIYLVIRCDTTRSNEWCRIRKLSAATQRRNEVRIFQYSNSRPRAGFCEADPGESPLRQIAYAPDIRRTPYGAEKSIKLHEHNTDTTTYRGGSRRNTLSTALHCGH